MGLAGTTPLWDSCYWERKKDLEGNIESIIANDNSLGQYYIMVADTDYALETACPLMYLESMPAPVTEFPQKIEPGMYLVNIDIQPGTYKGEAGADFAGSCYWERMSDLQGSLYSIISNDNSIGQFYVQVGASDFALTTACELERVGD